MKAKTASLVVKGIAVAMIVATWGFKMFVIRELTVLESILLAAAVLGTFGDVSLNIIIDKFRGVSSDQNDATSDKA